MTFGNSLVRLDLDLDIQSVVVIVAFLRPLSLVVQRSSDWGVPIVLLQVTCGRGPGGESRVVIYGASCM